MKTSLPFLKRVRKPVRPVRSDVVVLPNGATCIEFNGRLVSID